MVKRIVDVSFRLPDKIADVPRVVSRILDAYMKDVGPGMTYELIAFPDAHSIRLRSPGRLPAAIANRRFNPSLKLSTMWCPELAGLLLEKGIKPNE